MLKAVSLSLVLLLCSNNLLGQEEMCRELLEVKYHSPSPELLKIQITEFKNNYEQFVSWLKKYQAEGWKNYLNFSMIEKSLDEINSVSVNELLLVQAKMHSNTPGLEHPKFLEFRKQFVEYVKLVYRSITPQMESEFEKRKIYVAQLCIEQLKNPLAIIRSKLAQQLTWFEYADQASLWRKRFREYNSFPNLRMEISERYLSSLLTEEQKNISNQSAISSSITTHSGLFRSPVTAQVKGSANTQGEIELKLVPNEGVAETRAKFRGTLTSSTTSYTPQNVQVDGGANGVFHVFRSIYLYPEGIRFGSTNAMLNLNPYLSSYRSPRRLVGRISWRRAHRPETRREVQVQSTQNAKAQLIEEFNSQIESQLNQGAGAPPTAVQNTVLFPMIREGAEPTMVRTNSTHKQVNAWMKQEAFTQLAAPKQVDWSVGTLEDVRMTAHESYLNNTLEPIFGGKKYSDRFLKDLSKLLSDDVPFELEVNKTRPRYTINFRKYLPIEFNLLEENKVRITLHIDRGWVSEKLVQRKISVSALYELRLEGLRDQLTLFRVEAPKAKMEDGIANEISKEVRYLGSKLGALLQEKLNMGGLEIPDSGALSNLNNATIINYGTQLGWFSVNVRYKN